MVLRGIDPLLSGELLRHLDELGHGELLALVDRDYPAFASGAPVVRLDADVTVAARAILSVLPLDGDGTIGAMVAEPEVSSARRESPDAGLARDGETPDTHARVAAVAHASGSPAATIERIPRFAFYRRAAAARLVILTREDRPYSDFLLTKGALGPSGVR